MLKPEAQPLLFGNHRVNQVDRDPVHLASRLAQHYNLIDYGPRPGFERQFMHRSFTAAAGSLLVTCGYASPLYGVMGAKDNTGSINLIRSGAVDYKANGKTFAIRPKQPVFFSPTLEYSYCSDHYNGVVFDISISRLRETAAAMLGSTAHHAKLQHQINNCQTFGLDDGRVTQLIQRLTQALTMLDDPGGQLTVDLPYLQIDDLIYRILCLLVAPEIFYEPIDHTDGAASRDRTFDELLEWIRAHLNTGINLSQLEQRSGYSRRTLQKMFLARYSCGPIQWVRRQRLEQAKQALLDPGPTDTVSSIAYRFGFRSLVVFSREFTRQHGVNPSAILRIGRQVHG